MSHSFHITQHDTQQDLATRIRRRRETAQAALAMFDGDRLALIAALSRRARAAGNTSPGAAATTGAASVHHNAARDGRPAAVGRPLLVAD
jgi:hypothetical protein